MYCVVYVRWWRIWLMLSPNYIYMKPIIMEKYWYISDKFPMEFLSLLFRLPFFHAGNIDRIKLCWAKTMLICVVQKLFRLVVSGFNGYLKDDTIPLCVNSILWSLISALTETTYVPYYIMLNCVHGILHTYILRLNTTSIYRTKLFRKRKQTMDTVLK